MVSNATLQVSVGRRCEEIISQVMTVLGQLSIRDNIVEPRLSIIGKVENVKHIILLLLHHLPAKVYDRLQSEGFVILLPAMSDKDRVSVGQRCILEFCAW